MKTVIIGCCLVFSTQAATAGDLGTVIGLSYGAFAAEQFSDGYYRSRDNSFSRIIAEGSIGKQTGSGFGWQADALYETAAGSAGPEYNIYGGNIHGNYQLGAFRLGGFVGAGATNNTYLNYRSSNFWYGGEVAADMGNFTIVAQAGMASANFGDASLDYTGKSFYQLEARYFIGDNIMVAARYGEAVSRFQNRDMGVTQYGIDGTIRLGQSRFYATAGYEQNYTNDNLNNAYSGRGSDQTYKIGISMMFGGDLRETLRERNPMLSPTGLVLLAPLNGGVWSD